MHSFPPKYFYFLKSLIDFLGGIFGLLLFSPIILITAILIYLEDGRPVIYSQKRIGKDLKPFPFYKFRSMVPDAENQLLDLQEFNECEGGTIFKMKNDPRLTKVGKFIRKWSIDEIPQFYNVLKGDMSLVGPRPPLPSELKKYTPSDYRRLDVLPGITGLWQVSGRSNLPFRQQVDLDLKYIDQQSLLLDLKILVKTIPAVLSQDGAF